MSVAMVGQEMRPEWWQAIDECRADRGMREWNARPAGSRAMPMTVEVNEAVSWWNARALDAAIRAKLDDVDELSWVERNAALLAVLDLHHEMTSECGRPAPCQTRLAIAKALGIEGPDCG
jgi:hypothetical protein